MSGELNYLKRDIHKTACEKGWWDEADLKSRNFGEIMMLIVTEASECYEHYRNGQDINEVFYGKNDKPDGVPIEMADIIIRVPDACAAFDIDIDRAMSIKMAFNETRPHRHGGKLA